MKRLLRIAFSAALLFLFENDVGAAEFVAMVQDLNALQNRMALGQAAGDTVAHRFGEAEKWIASADPSLWEDERNVRAGVVYLLSGGSPRALREMRDAGFVSQSVVPLLDAALAYAEGRSEGAKKLMAFDARTFSPILGGHLALVQGGSAIGVDDHLAADLLDLAVLLMPASLVEEASLRRAISFLDPANDGPKVGVVADRYAARYLASPFAPQFWDSFKRISDAVLQKGSDASLLARVESIYDKARPAEQREFYFELCRSAIFAGRFDEARTHLTRAEKAGPDGQGRARFVFYKRALDMLTGTDASAISLTRQAEAFGPQERRLAGIAARVAAALRPPAHDVPAGASPPAHDLPIVAEARRAIDASDASLKRAGSQ